MKNPPIYEELVKELVRVYDEGPSQSLGVFQNPVTAYTDQARLESEQRLLRSLPIPVAHVSQLPSAGSCLVHDALGVPILITRNRGGALRAMLNVCRHRGTRLLEDSGFCKVRKGFQCRYHGWAYDLDGALSQIPREELFPSLDKSKLNLRGLPVTERFGFVWVVATPTADHDFDTFLDPLEPDLGPLNLESHVVFRRATTTARTNWKIVMEAFLDGYHVRHLHKKTVGPTSRTTVATRSSPARTFEPSSVAAASTRRRHATRSRTSAMSPRRPTSSFRTRFSSRSRAS